MATTVKVSEGEDFVVVHQSRVFGSDPVETLKVDGVTGAVTVRGVVVDTGLVVDQTARDAAAAAQSTANGAQTVIDPTPFALSSGHKVTAVVTDALSVNAVVASDLQHRSAPGIGAAFGVIEQVSLDNDAHVVTVASKKMTTWTSPAAGHVYSEIAFLVQRDNTEVTRVKISGSDVSAPLEVIGSNNSDIAILLTDTNREQIIQKSDNGDLGIGTNGLGVTYLFSSGIFGLVMKANGGTQNVKLGQNTDLGASPTNGFVFLPISTDAGPPTTAPALSTGFFSNSSAVFINQTTHKLWAYFPGTGWLSVTFT